MSPTKDLGEELYTIYRKDLSLLFADIRSRLFQHIVFLMLILKADSPTFPASRRKVEAYLQDQTPPTEDLKKKMRYVLDIIGEIARSTHCWCYTHVNGQQRPFLSLEFVCFGLYISKVPRRFNRSIEDFSKDCHELRAHILHQVHSKPPRMGAPAYQIAYQWIENKLDTLGLRPADVRIPAEPSLTPDTEEYEEDDDLLESTLAHINTNSLLHKRKRPALCMETSPAPIIPNTSNHHISKRPVARRGGKFPRR